MPLLQALTKQERMVLADALAPKKFAQGEAIIEEGDVSGHAGQTPPVAMVAVSPCGRGGALPR